MDDDRYGFAGLDEEEAKYWFGDGRLEIDAAPADNQGDIADSGSKGGRSRDDGSGSMDNEFGDISGRHLRGGINEYYAEIDRQNRRNL
jgi:hypothetical protein